MMEPNYVYITITKSAYYTWLFNLTQDAHQEKNKLETCFTVGSRVPKCYMMKKASSVTILIILLIETVFRNAIKLAKGLYGLKMFLNSFHKRIACQTHVRSIILNTWLCISGAYVNAFKEPYIYLLE